MSAPMRITGLDDVIRGMRELERSVPGDVDQLLTESAEQLLPTIREQTQVGTGRSGAPGRLRDSTRVAKVRGRPGFLNARPYAATQHWGRTRRGVVRGTRFIWDAAQDAMPLIERHLVDGIARLASRHL